MQYCYSVILNVELYCSSIVKKNIILSLSLSSLISVSLSLKLHQTATHNTANPTPQSTAKPKKPISLSYTSCVKKKTSKTKTHHTVTQTFPQPLFFFNLHRKKKMVPNSASLIRKSPLFYSFMRFSHRSISHSTRIPQTQFRLACFVLVLRATLTLTRYFLAMEPSLRIWVVLKCDLGNWVLIIF